LRQAENKSDEYFRRSTQLEKERETWEKKAEKLQLEVEKLKKDNDDMVKALEEI